MMLGDFCKEDAPGFEFCRFRGGIWVFFLGIEFFVGVCEDEDER